MSVIEDRAYPLAALQIGESFILLGEECSRSSIEVDQRRVLQFLLELLPAVIKDRVFTVKMQDVVAEIPASGEHDRVEEFRWKYGFVKLR